MSKRKDTGCDFARVTSSIFGVAWKFRIRALLESDLDLEG